MQGVGGCERATVFLLVVALARVSRSAFPHVPDATFGSPPQSYAQRIDEASVICRDRRGAATGARRRAWLLLMVSTAFPSRAARRDRARLGQQRVARGAQLREACCGLQFAAAVSDRPRLLYYSLVFARILLCLFVCPELRANVKRA